jgi:hypothetical protein
MLYASAENCDWGVGLLHLNHHQAKKKVLAENKSKQHKARRQIKKKERQSERTS